jgi:hypothetical protein
MDVEVHRLAALVSIIKAVETGQLTAAMSYGPLPATVWLVFWAVNAIRRPLRRARTPSRACRAGTPEVRGEVRPI